MFEPEMYGKLVSRGDPLRQMKLMKPSQLSRFAKDRSVGFWNTHIEWLWQIGLLRADLIASTEPIEQQGLVNIGNDERQLVYADLRPILHKPEGWTDALSEPGQVRDDIQLRFHPLRYFVLHHLERVLGLHVAPIQILAAEHYTRLVNREVKEFGKWSASQEFSERITYWNDLATLAIVTEPCVYEAIFHRFSIPVQIEEESFRVALGDYCKSLSELYKRLKKVQIHQFRQDLCIAAELLDHNPGVHTLLRLGSGEMRLKLRGKLGGALLIKAMAEMIRRAAEYYSDVELPEEDELGLGSWRKDAKQKVYGSPRIFDGDRSVSLEVVRQSLLDYGARLRWYVEGSTEYGAIQRIVQPYSVGIEVINLRGQFVEKGAKGLAFRESLREDLKQSVFSFVTLDGDQEDNIRLVRAAAQNDDFCGRFFVHSPDFEFANFTLTELEEIIWNIAEENGTSPENRVTLREC